jgi:drug/metabolite transporter (DMT)-like permease
MEPGEALSTAAQIAVTLAGFAGVVVVFRRESVHEWSPIDKFRLRLLLTNSILSLTFCMIGLLLLAITPTPTEIWRWCSGGALVILLPFAIATTKSFRRLDPQQLKNAHATLFPFYLFVALGTGGTLLQFCNVGILNAFWPFFTGIVIQLLAATFQFTRIILVPRSSKNFAPPFP